jgi:hypothetical protein
VLDVLRRETAGEDVVFFGFVSDQGEATGFTRAGLHGIDDVFRGETFRSEKNCLLCVRASVVRDHAIRWYYTNLDSLFWREVVYRARHRRALFVEPAVGVYDTTTEGSLKKMRRDPAHALRHANAKVEAVFRFLERVGDYLRAAPEPARAVIWLLLLGNLKHARPKRRYASETAKWAFRLPLGVVLRLKLLAALALPSSPDFWRRIARRP